jgi:hypothetical protein
LHYCEDFGRVDHSSKSYGTAFSKASVFVKEVAREPVPSQTRHQLTLRIQSTSIMFSDWLQSFLDNGFAVVPGVLSESRAAQYQRSAFEWLKSFDNSALDLSKPGTWTQANLPVVSGINTFNHNGVAHERFTWDIRLEKSIIDVFNQLWQTEELLVSFDALNIILPGRPDHDP